MPVDRQIIVEIERVREDAGISRYRLAIKTGMSQAALGNLLNGKTLDIKLSTIKRIAEALGCDVEVILRPKL